jgi:hypothetical protein
MVDILLKKNLVNIVLVFLQEMPKARHCQKRSFRSLLAEQAYSTLPIWDIDSVLERLFAGLSRRISNFAKPDRSIILV